MKGAKTVFKLMLLGAISLLALAFALPRVRSTPAQAASCASAGCHAYLPIMAGPPPFPRLLTPANGAAIGSLAPLLYWAPLISGTYQLQLSADSSFATTIVNSTISIANPLPAQTYHVTGTNLDPTTQFYWRVGVLQQGNYLFSQPWTFTTPARNASLLPPPPQLLAPPDQTHILTTAVTLNWQSVPGTLYYAVGVYTQNGQIATKRLPAPTTTWSPPGLVARTTYTWKVKVLNQYGWSSYTTFWTFITP